MDIKDRVFNKLERHLPLGSIDFCYCLYLSNPFVFVVSRHRTTKLGDYRYDRKKNIHRISVNESLNPYSFLITFLHEVAHQKVMLRYGSGVRHHGTEWKQEFQKLLIHLLTLEILPDDLSKALAQYARNPRATSLGFQPLERVLERHDQHPTGDKLIDIPAGSFFVFKGKKYQKIEKRRTRVVCLRISNGHKYLISGMATVLMQDSGKPVNY